MSSSIKWCAVWFSVWPVLTRFQVNKAEDYEKRLYGGFWLIQ